MYYLRYVGSLTLDNINKCRYWVDFAYINNTENIVDVEYSNSISAIFKYTRKLKAKK